MKLELTLPERPGFLHAVPVLDLFALLWLLFLLAPSLLRQSGVAVELPPSKFQLERYEDAIVISLGQGGAGPTVHLGRELVTEEQLASRLDALRAEGAARQAMVLMQTDQDTPVGFERRLTEMVLEKGFRLALVGANAPAGIPAEPAPSD